MIEITRLRITDVVLRRGNLSRGGGTWQHDDWRVEGLLQNYNT
jgi:hypothetical protein